METNQSSNQISGFKKFMKSYTARIIISVFIILFLMIPTTQVSFLIEERKNRQDQVTQELKQEWGPEFTFYGTVIEIPRKNKAKDILYIFPEQSKEFMDTKVNERYRGIFKANLFTALVNSSSTFLFEKIKKNAENADLDWSNARILLMTGNQTRFTELSKMTVNERVVEIAGQFTNHTLYSYTSRFPIDPSTSKLMVRFHAEVNGTGSIIYSPTASKSSFTLKSNWMDPAFSGNSLPKNGSFKKGPNQFTAHWKNLSRIGSESQTSMNSIGPKKRTFSEIKFITLLDQYQLNERTIKYAILVLTLTFAVFFLVQIVGKTNVHPIHYLLIGLALLLFYSLLLSLSEHVGFNMAYLVSASTIVVLIFWYAKAILNSIKFAVVCSMSLTLLYGFLLVLVNLEVYALLVGSIGLLIVLAAIMSVTRKLNFD